MWHQPDGIHWAMLDGSRSGLVDVDFSMRFIPFDLDADGRIDLVNFGISVGVVWDVLAEQWERMFSLLRAFAEREGHANVPRSHVEDGERLGGWLMTQRKRYQAREWSEKMRFYEKRSAMSDEELARLEALGVRWPRANSRAAVSYR